MFKYKWAITYLVVLIVLSGCSRDSNKVYPFGWTASDAQTDSLTQALEWAYIHHASTDVLDSLTRKYDLLVKSSDEKDNHRARKHYWDGRLKLRHGDDAGAIRDFRDAISLTDSAKYPYDVARIRWNMEEDFPCTPETYRYLHDMIEFFGREGDLPLQADYLMNLGTLMKNIGDSQSALKYYSQADSVFRLYGDEENIAKNGINHATVLDLLNRDDEATAVLRKVLRHPSMDADPLTREIANWDIYLYSGDFDALRSAYANASTAPEPDEEYLKLYEGSLMKEYALRQMNDSAAYFSRLADGRDVEWSQLNYERDFTIGRGYAAMAAGDYQLAADLFLKSSEIADSIAADNISTRIAGLDTQRRINEFIHHEEMQRAAARNRLLLLVILIISAAALIVWILLRRIHRQQVNALREKLRREHSMRKVMGLQIAMADTDRIVEELRGLVGELPEKDESIAQVRRKLLESLNAHTIANSTRDSFLTTFSEIKPDFASRLATTYPGLSDAETRLAVFIALGLDNKHIARLLNVRPESVKQARWRLRNKMELGKEGNLDDILRSMAEG